MTRVACRDSVRLASLLILLLMGIPLPQTLLGEESPDGVWRDVKERALRAEGQRRILPARYRLVALSPTRLGRRFATAWVDSGAVASWADSTDGLSSSSARTSGTDTGRQERSEGVGPRHLASLDEPCGALTGRAVLGFANEEYNTTLGSQGLYPETPLSIRIGYRGGQILCYPARAARPGSRETVRLPSVSVEVEVDFATKDGAFREVFDAALGGGFSNASFSYAATPEELDGTYDPGLSEYENVRIVFHGSFDGPNTSGRVTKVGQRFGSAPESIPVGYWHARN